MKKYDAEVKVGNICVCMFAMCSYLFLSWAEKEIIAYVVTQGEWITDLNWKPNHITWAFGLLKFSIRLASIYLCVSNLARSKRTSNRNQFLFCLFTQIQKPTTLHKQIKKSPFSIVFDFLSIFGIASFFMFGAKNAINIVLYGEIYWSVLSPFLSLSFIPSHTFTHVSLSNSFSLSLGNEPKAAQALIQQQQQNTPSIILRSLRT